MSPRSLYEAHGGVEEDRGFHVERRRRVRPQLEANGRPARGLVATYVKIAVLGLWLAGSYLLLVFTADPGRDS